MLPFKAAFKQQPQTHLRCLGEEWHSGQRALKDPRVIQRSGPEGSKTFVHLLIVQKMML